MFVILPAAVSACALETYTLAIATNEYNTAFGKIY